MSSELIICKWWLNWCLYFESELEHERELEKVYMKPPKEGFWNPIWKDSLHFWENMALKAHSNYPLENWHFSSIYKRETFRHLSGSVNSLGRCVVLGASFGKLFFPLPILNSGFFQEDERGRSRHTNTRVRAHSVLLSQICFTVKKFKYTRTIWVWFLKSFPTVTRKFPVNSNGRMERLMCNFHLMGYYCSLNLSSHQNST